jgi:hypothetical protein
MSGSAEQPPNPVVTEIPVDPRRLNNGPLFSSLKGLQGLETQLEPPMREEGRKGIVQEERCFHFCPLPSSPGSAS